MEAQIEEWREEVERLIAETDPGDAPRLARLSPMLKMLNEGRGDLAAQFRLDDNGMLIETPEKQNDKEASGVSMGAGTVAFLVLLLIGLTICGVTLFHYWCRHRKSATDEESLQYADKGNGEWVREGSSVEMAAMTSTERGTAQGDTAKSARVH